MKAINIDGTIKKYSSIPKSWENIIGGFNTLSDSDLETYGFYNVTTPSTNPSQELGVIKFDSDNGVFTYVVENKTFSQTVAEMKSQKISNLKSSAGYELAKTDWYITRKAELGTSVPSSITTARAEVRSLVDTSETEINALTTKASIANYQLPIFI